MEKNYDSKVTHFNFYEGQRCFFFDPVTRVGECFKIRRKWRGPFWISKITSHNVNLYNPITNKYVEKSVHINQIIPCYQRDSIPEDDEVIEDLPIVEVTYPRIIQTPSTSATSQQTNEKQQPAQETKSRSSDNSPEITET